MNISTFESLLLYEKYKEDVVYEFDYDVIKIKKGNFENVDYPCYLRFEKKEDNKVRVIRVKMKEKIPVLN